MRIMLFYMEITSYNKPGKSQKKTESCQEHKSKGWGIIHIKELGVAVRICKTSSAGEVEAGGMGVRGQPQLHRRSRPTKSVW